MATNLIEHVRADELVECAAHEAEADAALADAAPRDTIPCPPPDVGELPF